MDEAKQKKISALSWEALEYPHRERSVDWYWAVGLIALLLVVSSIFLGNLLFAVLVVVGTGTLLIYAIRKPRVATFTLTPTSIVVNETRYPYVSLDSFWVEMDNHGDRKLIVQSNKTLSPYLIFPLGETDGHEVREYLLGCLPEQEHREPIFHKLMDHLGF